MSDTHKHFWLVCIDVEPICGGVVRSSLSSGPGQCDRWGADDWLSDGSAVSSCVAGNKTERD